MIEVVADNSEQPNSRWYTGSGIDCPVLLHVKNKTQFELDGVTVETISIPPPTVKLTAKKTGGDVAFSVMDEGKEIVALCGEETLVFEGAKLWSAETPNLYTLKASFIENGENVDEAEISFGIREIRWSTEGLFSNDENVLLRGGCVYHDNGILGEVLIGSSSEDIRQQGSFYITEDRIVEGKARGMYACTEVIKG